MGNNHKKEYLVRVDSPITKEFLTKMAEGTDREQVKLETTIKKKKKGGSGLRVGKSRVVEKKTQPPKQNSPIRKGRKV